MLLVTLDTTREETKGVADETCQVLFGRGPSAQVVQGALVYADGVASAIAPIMPSATGTMMCSYGVPAHMMDGSPES